jgi:2-dehydro-3-deoxyphosphogalactonate aldolase
MNAGRFRALFAQAPVIAVLRGLTAADAEPVGAALIAGGLRILECPLNAGEPLAAIAALKAAFGAQALIGAGTVLTPADVDAAACAGAELIVAPNTDDAVIARAKALGLAIAPGVATPSEMFRAHALGADALKLFPAEMIPPAAVKALRAVAPRGALLVPVGGMTPETIPAYRAAGADGFGAGSQLWKPGAAVTDLAARARAYVQTARGESA